MMKLAATLAIAVAFIAQTPKTSPTPYSVKGDVLGESLAQFQQHNPSCEPDESNHCFFLRDGESFAGLPTARAAKFFDGKLANVTFSFSHNKKEYAGLLEALTAKYGAPTAKEVEQIQNRMGAQFQSENYFWDNGVSSIGLYEYVRDIQTTSLIFAHTELAVAAEKSETEKRLKKAKGDM
jgi:hypothetical protein